MATKADRAKRMLGGALTMTLASFLVKLLGLGYKIPLSYILSNEGLGYFNSAYTVYSFFYLISVAGVPKAVTIIISEAKSELEDGRVARIYKIAMKAFFLIGLGLCVALILLSGVLADFINNPRSVYTIIIVAPSILFTSVSGVARGYLCAKMRFVDISLSQMLEAILKSILGVWLAVASSKAGFSEPIVAAATILGATLGTLVSTLYLILVSKSKKMQKSNDNTRQKTATQLDERETLRKIFRISVPITLSAAVMSLTNMIDLSLIMRRLCALGYTQENASALYGIYTTMVVPMIGLVGAVVTPVSVSFVPHMAKSYSSLHFKEFRESFELALRLCAVIAVPMCVGMFFYSREILCLIFEDKDTVISVPLLKVASLGVVFSAMSTVINSALEAADFVRTPINTTLGGALAKLAVSYILIGNESFGIMGAPIGTVIAAFVTFVLGVVAVGRQIKIKVPVFGSLGVPIFASFVMLLLTKTVISGVENHLSDTLQSLLSFSLCFVFYTVVVLIFVIFSKNRHFFRQNAQKNRSIIMEYDENVNR